MNVKNRNMQLIPLLLVLAMFLCLGGCKSEQEETEHEMTEVEIQESEEKLAEIASVFNKTIYDFEGYEIYNLDDSEDNNFVVWQKGVIEIELSEHVNVIEEANEDTLTYTFRNADETLKNLQKGDVFYGMSADGTTAVAGKVKSIKVSGDTVFIEGDTLELGDLYEYVDIDMSVGAENVIVGELPEGVTVDYITEDMADPMSAKDGTYYATPLGSTATGETHAASLGFGGEGGFRTALTFTVPVTVYSGDRPMGTDLTNPGETGTSVDGNLELTGTFTYTLKGADVEFHFLDNVAIFHVGAQVHSNSGLSFELTGSGTISITQLIVPAINIPIPGLPLGSVGGRLNLTASARGSITGAIQGSLDHTDGFVIGCTLEDGYYGGKIEERGTPAVEMNVEKLAGTVLIGFLFETDIGMLGAAETYAEAFAGLEFQGSYDPFETKFSPEEAVHDCDACIDGSVDMLGRVRVGAKVQIPGLKQKGVYYTFPEARLDFMDFYISFGREGINEPEFGWEKCPYKRFRTDITVLNEGEKVENAKVKGESADGRTFETTTDENGSAELFLPVGDNLVTASAQGAKGTANVPIKDSPVSVTINLTDEREIFVCYWCPEWCFISDHGHSDTLVASHDIERCPYIAEAFRSRYPEVQFIRKEEWNALTNEPISAALAEKYGISPGDIIIGLQASETHTQAFLNGELVSVCTGHPHVIELLVGIVLLPSEADIESGLRSDEPYTIWFEDYFVELQSEIFLSGNSREDATSWCSSIASHITEQHWLGMKYDDEFRVIESENTGYWTGMTEKDIVQGGNVLEYNFLTNMESYARLNLEFALQQIDPTVNALWNNEWDRDESGDIVVSENEGDASGDIVVSETT